MASVYMQLSGAKEIRRKLESLDRKLQTKIIRQAVRVGAKGTLAAAKAAAPVDTGLMRKKLRIKAMKRKKGRIGVSIVAGKDDYQGKAFYAPFIEFGHHLGNRDIKDHPFIEGKHFINGAFDSTKNAASDAIQNEIAKGIAAAIAGA